MPLSWNEIRSRAIRFSKDWENVTTEDAEAKTFLDQFFEVFGISRRRVASFEYRVRKIDNKTGYIDMLWKGQILIEMKSGGSNLDKAYKQATDYFPGLTEAELPRCILVCDFERFRLYDLDNDVVSEFTLKELHKNIRHFGFLIGLELKKFEEQSPVNIEAAEKMGKLHDQLEAVGYKGHKLELYLVRLVFCLFADDTGIFDRGIFFDYIRNRTSDDGRNLAAALAELFHILNTPLNERLSNLDDDVKQFPYVNGKLFEETLPPAAFDSGMRQALLECCAVDWSQISPAIFGSLFQSVMNPDERRNLGAHYTSEKNIMKVIKPLFLDDLWTRFEKVKSNKKELVKFHDEISMMRFLDPACGCGNFLIIAYRELRLLELEIIKNLFPKEQHVLQHDLDVYVKVNIDRFYGIEYEEFPAQIATVAMWLIDHQMNNLVSTTFGENYIRLPLRKSATIKQANALRFDWHGMIDPIPWEKREQKFDFIFGNPPFIGKSLQSKEQKEDMDIVFDSVDNAGILDYVTAWYLKSAKYLRDHSNPKYPVRCAFVSTNSIAQGEQVGILWGTLYKAYHIKIIFAHRTFQWTNEAKGNAGVYVVIIGFSNIDLSSKSLFEYTSVKSEPHRISARNINPYLVEGNDIIVPTRKHPICSIPEMIYGSKPTDGGNLLLTDEDKKELVKIEPESKKYIKPFISAKEFLNNERRWCLWLVNVDPSILRKMPHTMKRIQAVKEMRLKSTKAPTIKLAQQPSLFAEIRQPNSDYIIVPQHTSENRKYIPIGFFTKENIVANSCSAIPNATLYHFGILTSEMHMTWVKYVCGRLESRFRYSNDIVYNNYPWPESPDAKQREYVETRAEMVLKARSNYNESSLADLYDPLTMPADLVKAHNELDRAVDLCYRPQPFTSEANRLEFLFALYEKYTSGLFSEVLPAKKSSKKLKA